MNILVIHNSYQQPGGEDQVFKLECSLLESYGHRVIRFHEHNDGVKQRNTVELITDTIWNRWTYQQLRNLIREAQIDIMHVHNTFPLVSPACYHAAASENIPVVQTLHNYRLLCPSATFYRNGGVCEDCLGKRLPWPSIVHSCYRGSRSATAATAAMLTAHHTLGTWENKVSAYIALTNFARNKFIEGGLPAEKIFIKPNFLDIDPGIGSGDGEFALFLGRLTEEKGVRTLLEAWKSDSLLPIEIIGDGPLANEVEQAAKENEAIRWRGWQSREQVFEKMKRAKVLILPSTWYESFPVTLVEAFAMGVPVIASRLGSLASLVEQGRTGLHFAPGNGSELAEQVRWAQSHPEQLAAMRQQSRLEFTQKYTGPQNYSELMAIYQRVLGNSAVADMSVPETAQTVNSV